MSVALALLAAGCANPSSQENQAGTQPAGTITIKNCGKEIRFPTPAQKIHVNEGQMLLTLLALDADSRIATLTGIRSSRLAQLKTMYDPARIDALPLKSEGYMSLESIVAGKPDVVMAGHGWGYSVEKNLTPERLLEEYKIPAYTYTPTCLPGSDPEADTRGPWDEATTDLRNVGAIVGHQDRADAVIEDLKKRRRALDAAPRADKRPTILYATMISDDGISSAGTTHMYQAAIDAAGATNALSSEKQKSIKISWEKVAAAKPDVLVITDTGEGNVESKIAVLTKHPATANLPAVVQNRIIKIPTDMGRSGALLMDSAEVLRKQLERLHLVPESTIRARMTLGTPS